MHGVMAVVAALIICGSVQPIVAAVQDRSADREAASAARDADKVELNTADQAGLETLPGVGPRTAELIIEYRTKNGGFRKIEELMNVRGIGERTFLRLRDLVKIGDPPQQ